MTRTAKPAAPKGPDNNKRLAALEKAAGRWGDPITASDASDLESVVVLANAIKAKINEMVVNG